MMINEPDRTDADLERAFKEWRANRGAVALRSDRQFLETLARNIDGMEREGAETDQPEGARFVKFSDTLLRQMAEAFRGIAHRMDLAAPNDWD